MVNLEKKNQPYPPRTIYVSVTIITGTTQEEFTQYKGGGGNKKWTGRSNTKFSVSIRPTETFYIPNQWKLNENLAELCRLEIAAFHWVR